MNAQTELERLRAEVAQLKQQLEQQLKQQLSTPNLPSLRDNYEFLLDLCRFSENLEGYSQSEVRRKWRFTEETWTALGNDDELVRIIEKTRLQRVRDGSFKREKSQALIVKGPAILDSIATSPKSSDKHKIDALRALDSLAEPPGSQAADTSERVVVTINLGSDVLRFGGSVKPTPDDTKIIEPGLPGFMIAAEKEDRGGDPI